MMEPSYRHVKTQDFEKIKQMLEDAWHYSEMFESKEVGEAFVNLFLNQTLHKCSYGQVAILDHEVVGFIFGRIKDQEPSLRMLKNDFYELLLPFINASASDQQAMTNYLNQTFESYEKMLKDSGKYYDSFVELFVVDSKARGYHVGTTLMKNLEQTFSEQGAENVHLYTDTDCNYGFYDYKNFNRVGELTPKKAEDSESNSFTYFMYDKEFEG